MSHLLKRYFFAAVLRIGALFGWLDGLCSDFVFSRATTLSWATIRFARERGATHEELRDFETAFCRGDFRWAPDHVPPHKLGDYPVTSEELAARAYFIPPEEKGGQP